VWDEHALDKTLPFCVCSRGYARLACSLVVTQGEEAERLLMVTLTHKYGHKDLTNNTSARAEDCVIESLL